MSGQRILSKVFDEPELRFYRDKLRIHASYIDRKFKLKKGRDIKPPQVEEILNDLKDCSTQLEAMNNVDDAIIYIDTISFQCEAALMFYDDKDNPARYLETLKTKVLPLLKDI